MVDIGMFISFAKSTRIWRDQVLRKLVEVGCSDLSIRPSSGMSSFGWIIAHQAAVFGYTLTVLIKRQSPTNPTFFNSYVPGSSGDWDGTTTLEEMLAYYNDSERDFFEWLTNAPESELDKVVEGEGIPKFFAGLTVIEIIGHMFAHLNYHTGHLESLRRNWIAQNRLEL